MVKNYIYLWISSMIFSCIKDDKLSLHLIENNSNKLKLEGAYIASDSSDFIEIYFLYRDGTILSRGSSNSSDVENRLNRISKDTINKYKNIKFLWGRYQIDGDRILFERWYPSEIPYRCLIKEGKILNDTTFFINKSFSSNRRHAFDESESYRFHKFNFKPDSTNIYNVGQR